MTDPAPDRARPPSPPESPPSTAVRTVCSDELLRGMREVHIEHAGEIYRLRVTRNGKLILQK